MPTRVRDRLILHAGMHKTGSTSLQNALSSGAGENVHVMRLGQPNHSAPCIALFAENPEQHFSFRRQGLGVDDLATKRQDLETRVRRQLRNRPEDTFVLSAEWLSTASEAALNRLKDRFCPHFKTTTVYAYIRPPADFMRSSLQQNIKTGAQKFSMHWPNYRERFERLDRVFGQENVALRPYLPAAMERGDIVQDFAKWSNIAISNDVAARRNSSMSAPALALIACYRRNSKTPVKSPESRKRDRQIFAELIALDGPKFALCPQVVSQEIAAHGDDLAWIEARLGWALSPAAEIAVEAPYLIGCNDDLKRAAARFAPLLQGNPETVPPEDPAQADTLAWTQLRSFLSRRPPLSDL